MKNVKAILLLVLFGGMFMLAVAETIEEFDDTSSDGRFELLESNRSINTTNKGFIKNMSISIEGFNFTQPNTTIAVTSSFFYNFTTNETIAFNDDKIQSFFQNEVDIFIQKLFNAGQTQIRIESTASSSRNVSDKANWTNLLNTPSCDGVVFSNENIPLFNSSITGDLSKGKYMCVNTVNLDKGQTALLRFSNTGASRTTFTWRWWSEDISFTNLTIAVNNVINYTNVSHLFGNTTINLDNSLFKRTFNNNTFFKPITSHY